MVDKKYTVEDWKNGRIDKEFREGSINGFNHEIPHDIGWVPKELYKQGLMEESEYLKIDKLQENVFRSAAKFSVEAQFKRFNNEYERAPEPEKFLNHKKGKVQSFIDDLDKFKGMLYSGKWDRSGIGQKEYQTIKSLLESKNKYKNSIDLTDSAYSPSWYGYTSYEPPALLNQTMPYNPLYDLTVANGFLKELNQLQKSEKKHIFNEDQPSERNELSREKIFQKAQQLKRDGMKVVDMFNEIKKWLLDDLGFSPHYS